MTGATLPVAMMLVDTSGGELRQLSEKAFEDPGRFSPEGDGLLTSAGGRLMITDLDGEVLHTIEESGAHLFGAVWSPDAEWIAYSRAVGGFSPTFSSAGPMDPTSGSDSHVSQRDPR